ncbi:MAG: potassium transporter Kup [Ilumatobacteraceae bacterium]
MATPRNHDTTAAASPATHHARTAVLAIGALGVVYGDIGTNPLFAMREAFTARHRVALDASNTIGLLSLMFWSLIVVVTIKYLTTVMRADNDGEGGILALAALVSGKGDATKGRRWVLVLVGILGAALLYGDGMVTPAISVLAAVEGTAVATPSFKHYIVPIACIILVGLFAVQRKGTAVIGRIFGPTMIVWFATIAVLGANQLRREPRVLRAVWPGYGVQFFVDNGIKGFLVLGAVILVVVGGEALYADMGHFGRRPIMFGWYGLVLPSLILVYFGQGALLIRDPSAIDNPFFRMAPHAVLYPLALLATVATVIASQALISGAFSLTHQAIQLGYSPRMQVRHTSESQIGQIYVPAINWLLMCACIGLVLGFRHSASLAAAYGLAVSTTMVMTTVLFSVVARRHFGWHKATVVAVCSVFLVVDTAFFGATLFKIPDGGWFPLVVGALIFTVMTTWRTGRRIVRARLRRHMPELTQFVASMSSSSVVRTPGACAYLFSVAGVAPPALIASLHHHDSLHERVLVICVTVEPRPRVPTPRRAVITDLGAGIHQVVLHFGFMEQPNVPKALAERVAMRLGIDLSTLTYFIGSERITVTKRPGMAMWREHLYAFMSRNATGTIELFKLPIEQTLQIGVGVEL